MPVLFSTETPTFRRSTDGTRTLLEEITVTVDGRSWTIPAGFQTDFSSIPAVPFARLLIDWRRVDMAGVVHDFLYQQAPGGITRKQADEVWRRVARAGAYAAGPFQALLGYLGLRAGGWYVWNGYRR